MSLLRMDRLSDAEHAVREALLVRPQGRTYRLGLGMVLRAEGKFPEALREVEAELALDPRNPQASSLRNEIVRQMQAATEYPAAGRRTTPQN